MSVYLDTADQFTLINGAHLHYLDWGENAPVLLFLPGIGEPASVFKWFAPRFLPSFRPVALTRRGTGKSEIVPGTYQLPKLVEDVRALVDFLGIGTIDAVGHSYGGFEIARLASLYPEAVRSVVFLDAVYSSEHVALWGHDPVPSPQEPAPSSALRSFHDYFSYLRAAFPFADKNWALPTEEAWAVDVEIGPDGNLREIDRGTAIADMMASASQEPIDYSAIRCPVLAIAAFEDHHPNLPRDADHELRQKADEYHQRNIAAKRAALTALRQQKPEAVIIEVTDAPHHLYLTHSDLVYAHMTEFLSAQGKRRSA